MTTVQSAGSPTHSNGIRTVSRFTYTQQWHLYSQLVHLHTAGSPTHSNGICTVSRFTYTQQWQLYTSVFSSLHTFCHRDLDLDPITWIYDLDLDLLKMSLCVKNEHYRSMHSKYRASAGMLFCSRYLDSEPVPLRYNID